MFRGLWQLTWLELKIFIREPMGVVGSVVVPVALFVLLARVAGRLGPRAAQAPSVLTSDLPIFVSMLLALSAVQSLVTIVSIYREGGILKRLRATPLRPHTILGAHVLVKLLLTAVTLGAMVLLGRRFHPLAAGVPVLSFAVAVLWVTTSILGIGFLIASLVPTARFAQPMSALMLYPMLALSGLFMPVASMPQTLQHVAHALPLTYAVSLLRGIWHGAGWMAHAGDAAVLALMLAVCLTLSARVFRWE